MASMVNRATCIQVMVVVLLALLSKVVSAAEVIYYHTDGLGSVVMESNSHAHVVYSQEYRPYGEPALGAVKDSPGYTGHVQDVATGLTYMQQRYYDPLLGRFLSVDPVGVSPINGLNFNRYWYASNNPYKNTDPDGRCDGPSTCAIDRDIAAMNRGDMSRSEFMDRSAARAAGAIGGLAVLATRGAIARYLPAVARYLSRNSDGGEQAPKTDIKATPGDTRNSVDQIYTNMSPKDAQKNLSKEGYSSTTSKDGKAVVMEKDGKSYTFYEKASSTKGPSADVKVNGETQVKIRFESPPEKLK